MSKIFDRHDDAVARDSGRGFMRVNEDEWFRIMQPLLVWMANTTRGRLLLRLEQSSIRGRIHRIAKNFVSHDDIVRSPGGWQRVSTTEFRVGAKYANLIRYQWAWFCELAREYYAAMERRGFRHIGQHIPVALWPGFQFGTTSTFYPDPSPESTTVDGTCGWSGSDTAFATVRAHAGNATNPNDSAAAANDSLNNYLCRLLNGSVDFNQLRQMNRACFLFDTSAIPDSDTISASTFSIAGNGGPTIDGVNGTNNSVRLDKCNPASNTAIAGTDFDITKWDSVAQSDTALLYDSWPADNVYADFALNATGLGNISKTGVTKLGLRDSIDFLDTGLSGNLLTVQDGGNCDFADTSGTSTDPKLVVVHASAAALHRGMFALVAGM